MGDVDYDGMDERMEAIRLKALLDPDALTEQEIMCLQIEQSGGGCPSCGAPWA